MSVLRVVLLTVGLCGSTAAEAACPATAADLAADLSQATGSFLTMDAAGFTTGHDAARADLGCMTEQLAPIDVAEFHRVEALAGFLARDTETVKAAFRASAAVQPAYKLPSNIAPPGSPLDQRYAEALLLPPSATIRVSPPDGGTLFVDGTRTTSVPTERPVVLQLVAVNGTIAWTGWARELAAAPVWAQTPATVVAPPPLVELPATTPVVPPKRSLKVPVLASAGGVALVSGGLFVAGLSARSKFNDPETPYAEVEPLQRRANTLGYAAQAGVVVAVGLGTVAFVVPL